MDRQGGYSDDEQLLEHEDHTQKQEKVEGRENIDYYLNNFKLMSGVP